MGAGRHVTLQVSNRFAGYSRPSPRCKGGIVMTEVNICQMLTSSPWVTLCLSGFRHQHWHCRPCLGLSCPLYSWLDCRQIVAQQRHQVSVPNVQPVTFQVPNMDGTVQLFLYDNTFSDRWPAVLHFTSSRLSSSLGFSLPVPQQVMAKALVADTSSVTMGMPQLHTLNLLTAMILALYKYVHQSILWLAQSISFTTVTVASGVTMSMWSFIPLKLIISTNKNFTL